MYTEEAGTRVKLRKRRGCAGCGKTLWGGSALRCAACQDDELERKTAGKRLCSECGVNPIPRRRRKCADCRKENAAWQCVKWQKENPDRVRANRKRWNAKNHQKMRDMINRWRRSEKGKAARRKYQAVWRERRREHIRKYNRDWQRRAAAKKRKG